MKVEEISRQRDHQGQIPCGWKEVSGVCWDWAFGDLITQVLREDGEQGGERERDEV